MVVSLHLSSGLAKHSQPELSNGRGRNSMVWGQNLFLFPKVTEVLKNQQIGKSLFPQITSHNGTTGSFCGEESVKPNFHLALPSSTFDCRLSNRGSDFCQHVTVELYIRSLENHLGDF